MTMTRTRTLLASTAVHMALAALPAAALVMMTASEAAAQAEPIPPENYTLDSRGVDLVTGGLVYSATDLVIGTPGQGGIAHGRVWVNGGWAETLTGTILVSGSTHVVSLGGVSEVFTKSGSTFTPASNRGATLTQVNGLLTFTASDGTIAEYSTAYSGSTIRFAANNAALMKVTRPNGEILTYHWDGVTYCRQYELIDYPEGEEHPPLECIQYRNAVRLDAVRNNRGYQINFRYASDDAPEGLAAAESDWFRRTGAIGFNMGVDYCDPNSSACTGSRTWPRSSTPRAETSAAA
jgi:hypothetical protein